MGLGEVCSEECLKLVLNARPARAQQQKAKRPPADVPPKTRTAVLERDRGRCRMCGVPANTIHHIRYKSEGVDHQAHNLIVLCGRGNAEGCHGVVHSAKRVWQPLCRAYIWRLYVDGRQQYLPALKKEIERWPSS